MMNEPFDYQAFHDAELAPLLKQLHEKCSEHDIPMIACVAYSLDVTGEGAVRYGMYYAAHLPGPGRTPLSFRIASAAIQNGPAKAAAVAKYVSALIETSETEPVDSEVSGHA